MKAADMLSVARGGSMICGCGRPLLPRLDADGNRVGVTHAPEDDDHHLAFWGGLVVEVAEDVIVCGVGGGAPGTEEGEPAREDGRCPKCGGEVEHGCGLAFGGIGAYAFCVADDCDWFWKRQDPE